MYGKAIYRVNELIEDKNPTIALAACKLAFEDEQNILRIAEETAMLCQLEERMDALNYRGDAPWTRRHRRGKPITIAVCPPLRSQLRIQRPPQPKAQ